MEEKLMKMPSKALVGLIHVRGFKDEGYSLRPIREVIDEALGEATQLIEAGFDAVLVYSNSLQLQKMGCAGPETVAMTTAVASTLHEKLSCPVGVQILDGINRETLAVAHATEASFIRVRGFDSSSAGTFINYQKNVDSGPLSIVAQMKHKDEQGLLDESRAAALLGAKSIAIGSASYSSELMRKLKKDSDLQLWVDFGVSSENLIGLWPYADAFVIDELIRKGLHASQPLDPVLLKRFSSVVDHLKHSIAT